MLVNVSNVTWQIMSPQKADGAGGDSGSDMLPL